MKKVAMIMLAVLFLAAACSKETEDRKNLSAVRVPGQTTLTLIDQTNDWAKTRDLAKTDPKDFIKFLYSVNPDLDRDVIRELTQYHKIDAGERVTLRYHYFNKEGVCAMEDKEGKFTKVKFKNEVVVEIIRPNKKTLWVALVCLNGMLDIDEAPGISGDALMEFTIEKGQGLSRYLADDYWAIEVARTFNLPLYKGRIQSEKHRISPDQAKLLVPNTSETQITVYTEAGWKFVLRGNNWTLNGSTPAQLPRH